MEENIIKIGIERLRDFKEHPFGKKIMKENWGYRRENIDMVNLFKDSEEGGICGSE